MSQPRPTTVLKAAITLDGQLAATDGTSQWITGPEARADAHRLRAGVDAVMVGAGTVIDDDPQLTVRLADFDGDQPVPVVVAGRRSLPRAAVVFERDPIVLAPAALELPGRVIVCSSDRPGRVDLARGLELLHGLGIRRLLVEGGSVLAAELLQAGLIDTGVVYLGARLAGGVGRPMLAGSWSTLAAAATIRYTQSRLIGEDVRIDFEVVS